MSEKEAIAHLEFLLNNGMLAREDEEPVETILQLLEKKECIMCQQDDIDSNIWMCSKCKDDFYWGDDADSAKNSNLKYCPFCGAKIKEFSYIEMDEDE